jgi:hypothetical protein
MCTSPEQSIPRSVRPPHSYGVPRYGPRLLDVIARSWKARPLAVGLAAEGLRANPARVPVGRPDPRPVAVELLDRERLAGERLRDLLGRVVGLCADGRNVRAQARTSITSV